MQALRTTMIDGQLTPHNILDERILEAFEAVDRVDFMPEQYRQVAYVDGRHQVASGRHTLSLINIATMLQLADIKPTDTVMMIGCATGYAAAVCAKIAKHVYAVEENQELSTVARGIISQKAIEGVDIVSTPLVAGHGEHAPYDAIIIEGSIEALPEGLFKQLAEGGRLVFIKHVGKAAVGTQS